MREDSRNVWLESRPYVIYLLEALLGKSDFREMWKHHKFGF